MHCSTPKIQCLSKYLSIIFKLVDSGPINVAHSKSGKWCSFNRAEFTFILQLKQYKESDSSSSDDSEDEEMETEGAGARDDEGITCSWFSD